MSLVFNISQNKKKLKDLFVNRPIRHNKTFSCKKNAINFVGYTFPNPKFNKWKESQLDPYWIYYVSPFGG